MNITGKFKGWSKKYESSDVIIVGSGPAGLMAALDLAKLDLKTLVVEKNVYAGGRLWASDFLIHTSDSIDDVARILDEVKIPFRKGKGGLSVSSGPNFTSKLISAVCDAGVRILNMAEFRDLLIAGERASGLVVDWKGQLSLKDEVTGNVSAVLKSHAVVDATGLAASVSRFLMEKGLVRLEKLDGADVRASEGLLLEKTGVIYPGLAAAGMAVAGLYGIRQGGLTLCSMLLSGRKAANEVMVFLSEIFPVARKEK